jgi:hypothetical protein
LQGDHSLKLGDGEIRTVLIQILLGQAGMFACLPLRSDGRLGKQRRRNQGQQEGTEFFFKDIA